MLKGKEGPNKVKCTSETKNASRQVVQEQNTIFINILSLTNGSC